MTSHSKITHRRLVASEGPDFYPTPPWATYALIGNEPFEGKIWEPACGDGAMAEALSLAGYSVQATDLCAHGYGETGHDFLTSDRKCDNVITNPPYNLAQKFIEKALDVSEKKCAFLLRLAFLEGAERARTIFKEHPPARIWVFSERITFYKKDAQQAGSGTTAYAWFVWDKAHVGPTELKWIAPGYKAKFS